MTAPFCYSPSTNIDISPSSSMSPCCKFRTELYTEQFNIAAATIKDYSGSAFLAEIQNDFAQQQWPRGCVRCQTEEQHNIASKRQLDLTRWSQLMANTDDSEHFDQFCSKLRQHDQYRGTDFDTTFPELAKYT